MERKAKRGISAFFLLGVIYGVLGAFFVILGVCLWFFSADLEAQLVGGIFGGIGSVFFLLGIVFLALEFAKQHRANRLIAAGRYIWGEIVDFAPNYNIRINNRNPYVIMVRYLDAKGVAHIFRSPNLRIYPDRAIIGSQVKVYIQDETFMHYYVDLEGVLPRVIEH